MELSLENMEVVDRALLEENYGGSTDILQTAIESFLDTYMDTLHKIHSAIEGMDAEGVRQAAHMLKGSVSYVGGARAMAVADALQNAQDMDSMDSLKDVLDQEMKDLSQELQKLHAQLEASAA